MTAVSKTHLMTTSAIAGIAMLHLAPAAYAQSAFGVRNDQPDPLQVTVAQGDSVTGTDTGVFGAAGPVEVENAGTIRGNGTNLGGPTTLPSAGVMIAVGPSRVENSGTISGAANGITTVRFFNAQTGGLEGRARDTVIVNSGTVSGEGDDGIRLIGGGSVDNSGTISGFGNQFADGISMFPFEDQANEVYSASVSNAAAGTITGQRFGVILSEGGEVTNAGEIAGGNGGITLQAIGSSTAPGGIAASLVNSGTIEGTGDFGFTATEGEGVAFIGTLGTASLDNSGTIISAFNAGVSQGSSAQLRITNQQAGRIEGATSGIIVHAGSIDLTNAGTIRGNGVNVGNLNTLPGAGIVIRQPDSTIANTGEISGAQFGITTLSAADPVTGEFFRLAARTTVTNAGTITGEGNDAIRLIGGGRVENSGSISGRGNVQLADGISMFSFSEPAEAGYAASVANEASGTIAGDRFGIILSHGGDITNAGSITGVVGGVLLQGNVTPDFPPILPGTGTLTASLVNTGTISGTGDFGGGGGDGYGVAFGLDLATATLDNSGTITSAFSFGVNHRSLADLTITNAAGGRIEGATSGIYSGSGGTLAVVNAGTIRGNGTYDGFDAPPEAGITIATPGSSVTNSGTISGAGAGITTASLFNPQTNSLIGLAVGTSVVNSGTIAGEGNDGVRLIGGGSVENSGTITGTGGPFSDGVSMFPFADQANEDYAASVENAAAGTITGQRFGVILSAGGEVTNAGAISGGTGGVLIQGTALNVAPGEDRSGLTASLSNTGTIRGTGSFAFTDSDGYGVGFGGDLATATLVNSGTISSASNAGVSQASLAVLTITNAAGGRIEGATSGIIVDAGSLVLDNAGTIRGNGVNLGGFDTLPGAGVVIRQPDSTITNSGTISGAQFGIVSLSAFDETTGETANLAARNTVVNSGTILGEGNDGVRLVGGGRIENSGSITGRGSAGADGASMLAFVQPAGPDYSGSLFNAASGTITGDRFGIIFSNGAEVENEGTITGAVGGAFVQGDGLQGPATGPSTSLLTASVVNTGTISGTGDFGFGSLDGFGLGIAGDLASATVVNSGTITSAFSVGFQQASAGRVTLTNAAGGRIEGATSGIYSGSSGALVVINAGTIRGNGNYEGLDAPPEAGITIASPGSSVTNSGTISGAGAGITTAFLFDPRANRLIGLATGTSVVNSGIIAGEGNDGVRLIGGGSVVNSGSISGTGGPLSDGISMFPFTDQANEDYAASVDNAASGTIAGQRFGIILSAGGDVTNGGDITGGTGGVFVQGTALNVAPGEERSGLTASIANTGTISGTGDFGFAGADGDGVGFGGDLATATLTNSGTITSAFHAGVSQRSLADLAITNAAGGRIEGATSGIYAGSDGTLALVNAGTIRGNGTYDGFDAPPEAGVTIATARSSVTNSGTITGAGSGITTAFLFDSQTSSLVGRAVGTGVVNSGTIAGESNDGVRLIGGGSVDNAGTISGTGGQFADGVSMFRFDNIQPAEGYGAAVTNRAAGSITGSRFGIILSSGGTIDNAGTITGGAGGVSIQEQAGGGPGVQVARLVNAGTITATGGAGAQFTGALGPATLEKSGTIAGVTGGVTFSTGSAVTLANSGAITAAAAHAVQFNSATAAARIDNAAGGSLTGATSGVVALGAALELVNAGTIRGNGAAAAPGGAFNGGVRLQSGSNTITNSGMISGAQFGVVTAQTFIPATQSLGWQVGPTTLTNTGTIAGEGSDAIALFGGGTIVNSGTVTGGSGPGADGIQLQFYPGQDSGLTQIGRIDNLAGGTITGERYGIILAGGGTIANAGAISGGTNGVVLVSQNFPDKTGTLENSGTITGGVLIDLSDGEIINSGTITNAAGPGVQIDGGRIEFVNSGRISGAGTAIRFGAADDVLTLETGSIIEGAVDGGEGRDELVLDGDVLVLTQAQQLGETNGFESLAVAGGYWTTAGLVGAFDTLAIAAGATLRIAEITPAGGTAGSPLSVPAVTTDGALVLDFADAAALDAIAATPVTGTGSLQLVGEGVLTVAGSNLSHTGGTTVSNGGLILAGTLPGDVVTEGDGFFQIGIGGTEGAFAGNLVNNGRFVFNRSDDYDFAGDFSGTGVLDKLGAGVLIFSGAYDFSGVTNILGGAVRLAGVIDPETEFNLDSGGTLDVSGTDQTIAGLAGAPQAQVELGEQTLTINQNTSTTFAGTITGTGGIAKTGGGRLELTGNSTFTGPTTVNGGILAVNGSIISPVTVNPGGTLAGNGSVGNTTVSNGGVVAPGNSIGRLTVNGDLAFAAGAIYEVEADAAGRADRIDATGRVTIAGTAQLAVLAEAGAYRPRTDYTVLTATGGVSGRFGSVTSDLAFLTPFVRYGAGTVTLSLYRNDIAFAAAAGNANQAGVAGAVQALGIDNPLFEAVLVQNAAGAQAIFADLSGELHASAVTGLTDDSRHLRNALIAMPAATGPGLFVWGSGFGGWGQFDGTAANFGMDTDHNGLVTGIGFGGEGFAVAVSAGIAGSDFTLGGRSDNADVSTRFAALHGTVGSAGGIRGSAGLSYAWHDLDTTRAAAAPVAQTLAGETDAHTFQIFGEIGYELVAGKAAITPFARIAHVGTNADSFTETGGAAALSVNVARQETTFLSLGARVQVAGEGARFQPYAALAWNRAFGDRRAVAAARFAGGGAAFGVAGAAIPRDSAEIDAGFEYRAGRFGIGAAYTGVIASDREAHGGRITARWQF